MHTTEATLHFWIPTANTRWLNQPSAIDTRTSLGNPHPLSSFQTTHRQDDSVCHT